jgi:hypothetical protein
VKYRLPITLASVAVVLGLVAFAYFQNWVSVCALAIGFIARLAERILLPKRDAKLDELLNRLNGLETLLDASSKLSGDLHDRLGKLELRNGMRS